MAMELSREEEKFKEEDLNRARELIQEANPTLNLSNNFDEEKLIENMSVDKKRSRDQLIFIVLSEIGKANINSDIKESEIAKAIQSLV